MNDIFSHSSSNSKKTSSQSQTYTAADIEVLEGLEPVRKRPGMYIGGTDETAFHHLATEIIDNAMDEVVAGYGHIIEVTLKDDTLLEVRDNGRGIPIDPHAKFPDKSALEVIFTTLHAGGKFSGKVYETAGGLHGVGSSVVNALSETLTVEVIRDKILWQQSFSRGIVQTKLKKIKKTSRKSGTCVTFSPDPLIFGKQSFSPIKLYKLCKSKAALFRNVTIKWTCASHLLKDNFPPEKDILHFPNGLKDALNEDIKKEAKLLVPIWSNTVNFPDKNGKIEWAIAFLETGSNNFLSWVNTIPTPDGGSHETGFKATLLKGFKTWGEQQKIKDSGIIIADDFMSFINGRLSVFLKDPQFQGQTKNKLTSRYASRLVENALRDHFDHWLGQDPTRADTLLNHIIERARTRLSHKNNKEITRKSATRKLRLPGKLTDCRSVKTQDTEIFLVEGESAGGSARQARDKETQAILPLRGKILNVASASREKLFKNQELKDLIEALGCQTGKHYDESSLRYGRIIIMTDADVDGAHIASLLMTFFYTEMPELIKNGHLYLAQPPLYSLTQKGKGGKTLYAMTDKERDILKKKGFKKGAKIDISRFKGLGEMEPEDLKATTMNPAHRTLIQVTLPLQEKELAKTRVNELMGRKPELRFNFIQEHASLVKDLDI